MQNPVWLPLELFTQGVERGFVHVYIHRIIELKHVYEFHTLILIGDLLL